MEDDGGTGIHLILDCSYVGNSELLYDRNAISEFFNNLISSISMKPVGEMGFYRFPSRFQPHAPPPPSPLSATSPFPLPVFEDVESLYDDAPPLTPLTQFEGDFPESIDPKSGQFPEPETLEEKGGVTAFQTLSESHISIHTYPARRAFSLDLFSCRPYDYEAVIRRVGDSLLGGNMKACVIERSF